MSSITGWTRLEPRPRSQEFGQALQAQVRDPLWFLARQWQVGEFQASDGGTAISASLALDVAPINRFQAGNQGVARPYDPRRIPLEALVEHERVRQEEEPDLRQAAEAGLYFVRLLKEEGLEIRYRADYLERYPLPVPAEMDLNGQRFAAVMAGRAPNGDALERDLRGPLEGDPPVLPSLPAIDSADQATVLAIGLHWLAWWDSLFLEPEVEQQSWIPERFEYQFRVSAPATDGGERVLAAREYYTGELDWYAVDLQRNAQLGGDAGPGAAEQLVRTVVPTAVDFGGMPAPRWWEFEDGRVDFGNVEAAADDLARLLLLEFALIYGNDWLIMPVPLTVGSLSRIRSLVVTDTFGERITVPPLSEPGEADSGWGLFYLSELGAPLSQQVAGNDRYFFLAPTLVAGLESPPLEEVVLIRDEMANMAWAIERTVKGPDGRPQDRFEAYQEERRRREIPDETPEEEATAVYQLASTVPDHWIPLLPVRVGADQRAIALQRGAMLDPDTGGPILAQGRFLTPGQPLIIEDEEVTRAGVRATRSYQHARWTDGTSLLWMGRRKRSGRGEGSSGLRFDGFG